MRKLILFTAIIAISSLQAGNYDEKDCVHSYNTMTKYYNKAILNAKAKSRTKVNFNMAKRYAANAVVDCDNVRPELNYKAQEIFDTLVNIEEDVAQQMEEAEREAELQREIAEAEAEAAEAEAELQREIAEAEAEAAEELNDEN